jgi:MtaA/CmuA family methyltransferase
MTSFERFVNRLRGDAVDRPPNFDIMMGLAAHHIGEKLSSYYLDHRVLAEANLAVLEAFELDIVQAISDPYREASDFGLEVEFPEDGLPVRRGTVLTEPEKLDALDAPDPATSPRMSDRLEAIAYLHERVGGEVPVMGWVEGALAEATVLRGDTNLMLDLYDRPEWVEELLEVCVELEIDFARLQIQAGADIIGLGDSMASQVSPAAYARFALPYEQRIFDAVHEAGAWTRLHICGDTTHLIHLMPQSGADIIDIDWMVDMKACADAFGENAAVAGNFDPVTVMLQGTPADVYRATIACMQSGGERAISAAGCEIPDGTPPENLLAQSRALSDLGYCRQL